MIEQMKRTLNVEFKSLEENHDIELAPKYTTQNEHFEVAFECVLKLIKRSSKIDRITITNELKQLTENESHKEQIIAQINEGPDLLRAIIELYSSDIIYKKFNECFQLGHYQKIMYTTVSILKELQNRKNELSLSNNPCLYRGVPKHNLGLLEKNKEYY